MAYAALIRRGAVKGGSCAVAELHQGGKTIAMIRFGQERRRSSAVSCGDCGVGRSGWHHLGCDLQRCLTERIGTLSGPRMHDVCAALAVATDC